MTELNKEQADENKSKHHKRKGPGLPALARFAVGFAFGWYLHRIYNGQDQHNVSGPREFVKYTLIGKDSVSSTCAVFRLRPASNTSIDLDDPALERAITSVEFKQPQLQIARSYTCLPQEGGQHMDELRFLIRREQKGEVSNFIHRLPLGSEIEVRGLHPGYNLPDDVKSVAFLAGGTGIAPAMQVADLLAGQVDMHILWASRRRDDCLGGYSDSNTPASRSRSWWPRSASAVPDADRKIAQAEQGVLVSLLEGLKGHSAASQEQPPRLLVDYYVDEEGSSIEPNRVKTTLSALSRKDSSGAPGRSILFVSGPEGFINYWAGSKQWANGVEVQGPLQGVLSTMDLKGWEVVKL